MSSKVVDEWFITKDWFIIILIINYFQEYYLYYLYNSLIFKNSSMDNSIIKK
jgi:hypothetical protein